MQLSDIGTHIIAVPNNSFSLEVDFLVLLYLGTLS